MPLTEISSDKSSEQASSSLKLYKKCFQNSIAMGKTLNFLIKPDYDSILSKVFYFKNSLFIFTLQNIVSH